MLVCDVGLSVQQDTWVWWGRKMVDMVGWWGGGRKMVDVVEEDGGGGRLIEWGCASVT